MNCMIVHLRWPQGMVRCPGVVKLHCMSWYDCVRQLLERGHACFYFSEYMPSCVWMGTYMCLGRFSLLRLCLM